MKPVAHLPSWTVRSLSVAFRSVVLLVLLVTNLHGQSQSRALDRPTQRWLPLPNSGTQQAPPIMQMEAMQMLQQALAAKQDQLLPPMDEEQLQGLEDTFRKWQAETGSKDVPNLGSIPPEWINRAIGDPGMRSQVQKLLESYARDRQIPRSNSGVPLGGPAPPTQPPNPNVAQQDSVPDGEPSTGPNTGQNERSPARNSSTGASDRDDRGFTPWNSLTRRSNPSSDVPAASSQSKQGSDATERSGQGMPSFPESRGSPSGSLPRSDNPSPQTDPSSTPIQNKSNTQAPKPLSNSSNASTQERSPKGSDTINNPFDMLPENREELARQPDPNTSTPNGSGQKVDSQFSGEVPEMLQNLLGGGVPNSLGEKLAGSQELDEAKLAQIRDLVDRLAQENQLPTRRIPGSPEVSNNGLRESATSSKTGAAEDQRRAIAEFLKKAREKRQTQQRNDPLPSTQRGGTLRPFNAGEQASSRNRYATRPAGAPASSSARQQFGDRSSGSMESGRGSGSLADSRPESQSRAEGQPQLENGLTPEEMRKIGDQFANSSAEGSHFDLRPRDSSANNSESDSKLRAQLQESVRKNSQSIANLLRESGMSEGFSSENSRTNAAGNGLLKELAKSVDGDTLNDIVKSDAFGKSLQEVVEGTLKRERQAEIERSLDRQLGSSSGEFTEELKDTIERLTGKEMASDADVRSNPAESLADSITRNSSKGNNGSSSGNLGSNSGSQAGSKEASKGVGGMFTDILDSVKEKTASSSAPSMPSSSSSIGSSLGGLAMPEVSWSFGWSQLLTLVIIVAAIVAIWLLRSVVTNVDPEKAERRWVAQVLKSGIRTREDVVRAYHRLVLRSSNSVANWWTHRRVARQLPSEISPQLRDLLEEITNVYEVARYLPPEHELDDNQVKSVESAMRQFEAVGA